MNTKDKDERKTEMKTVLIILAIIMMAALPVSAQIPRLINYQGVLTDDMGVIVADGPYNMTFRIYDVPSGGTHLWEETTAVNVSKGIFNTTLGYTTSIDEVFDKPLYLALEIDGGGELSPRRLFMANAYAFSSRAVYGISNVFPAGGNVGIGISNPTAPLHIYTNIADHSEPSLLIQNTGSQSSVDFMMAMVTESRIRKAAGGDFFIGNVTGNGISFTISDNARHRMLPDGSFGVDNLSPLEKLDVNGAIRLGTTTNTNAGTLRWTGTDFEGYDGSLWQSLTSGGGSSLPAGAAGNTIRHNGADWVAASNLTNNGTNIGINTASPSVPLHIVQPSGQVGLRLDGYDASFASIYVNAATAPADPTYGYLRQGTIHGYHYLESDYSWNLNLNSSLAMHVEPNGWTTFGGGGLAESMNIPGALRLGNTTGNNAGSIRYTGSDFEGYVGGMWNSLTSGGLPAGTTGQTLRYDGAAWSASSNLYNSGTDIGIGTVTPSTNLHVYENVNGLMGIQIENPNTGSGSGEQIAFVDENGTVAGIRFYDDTSVSTYAGAMAIYNNRPSGSVLFRTGGMDRMKIMESGVIETYASIGLTSQLSSGTSGSYFRVYDESDNRTIALEADVSGTGGYFSVMRNETTSGFYVDGNYAGVEAPRVVIAGPSRSVDFNMNSAGNASVSLPADAISASEILDEPGVVSAASNTSTEILSTMTVLSSQTITAPAAGYVLVIASNQAQVGHITGTNTQVDFGVSASATALPANQDVLYLVPSGAATGTYCSPVTSHSLFEVGAGAHTFYFLGRKLADTYNAYSLDKQLTAIFIPTNYGLIETTLASGGPDDDSVPRDDGMTSGEISAAGANSTEANNARIERELAEMRARLEALQAELENQNR